MAPEDADQLAVTPVSVIKVDLIHEAGEEMSAERRGGVEVEACTIIVRRELFSLNLC